jgi:proline iminopeptidase
VNIRETSALSDGERHLVVSGLEHWVRIAGADHRGRPPIIAIHGGPGGNHYVFERTALPRLAAFATVICYEQRGCGRSARPLRDDDYGMDVLVADLDELRRTLALERMVLLGYSFGAELAIECALAHRESVAGLVLQAPSVEMGTEAAAHVQLKGFREVGVDAARATAAPGTSARDALRRVWETVDESTVDRFLFEDQGVAARNRALWRESGLTNSGLMERVVERERPARPVLSARIRSLAIPTLVLVGRHDRNVGVEASAAAAEELPLGQLHVFERSAHFPDLEEPPAYAQAIATFLAELTRATAAPPAPLPRA